MGGRVAFILLHLLLVMFAEASEGRQKMKELGEVDKKSKQIELNEHMKAASAENPVIRMVSKMGDNSQEINPMAAHSSSSSSHMEHTAHPVSEMVFFTINALKLGQKLPLFFPKRDPSTSPPLLSREITDPIPFSLKQLPQILSIFSFSPGSPQAQAMEDTLYQCEKEVTNGQIKLCATSSESMEEFVRTAVGAGADFPIEHLTTSHLTESDVNFQNYTIVEITKEITVHQFVPCHAMIYPYAVYYCHYQKGDTKVFQIQLEGENGDRVDLAAVCHTDTSGWSPSHVAFGMLKIQPGTLPVCHILSAGDLVWIPTST